MLKPNIFTDCVWELSDLVAQHRGGLQFLAAGETLETSLVISPTSSRETLSVVYRFLTGGTNLLLEAFLHHPALRPLAPRLGPGEGPGAWSWANINLGPQ